MEEEKEDRISQLPDPILQQILSSIDIKLAVQTSILSTRWKSLWLSLSHLHFHLSRHAAADPRVNLNTGQSAEAFSLLFSNFVTQFLSHRDHATTLRTFHLAFDNHFVHADTSFIQKCALYAVDHGVESLHLQARCDYPLHLPAAFFATKTLRELKLSQFNHGFHIPKVFSLPHLKILFLEHCELRDGVHGYTSPEEPFSGLPELEELTIRGCGLQGLVVFAPKLRFLEICENGLCSPLMKEISCPLLTSSRYEGYHPLHCSRINLPMLEEIHVNIYKKLGSYNDRHNEQWVAMMCVRMLKQLGNANIVTLTLNTVKLLGMDRDLIEQSPSPFPYIKCLRLRKGQREIPTVEESVMNYLKGGSLFCESLRVEIPEGVSIENTEVLFDKDRDDLHLERLFGIEDETSS